jgi:type IV pilus assembly protein PilC
MAYKRSLRLLDALTLFKHLSMTLKAGLNISEAVSSIDARRGSALKKVIDHLKQSVDSGHTFSEAMETAPRKFPTIVLQLIRTGEIGGNLRQNIEEASDYMTEVAETRREVRSAMLYPTLVFVAVMGLGLSISFFVLPQIIPLFESMNVELPVTTKILLFVAKMFDEHGILIIVSAIVIFILLLIIFKARALKPITCPIILYIPFIGKIVHLFNLTRICRTLGSLLGSGIPIVEALKITSESIDNPIYSGIMRDAAKEVADGNPFSDALMRHHRIPHLFQRLVAVGERTGSTKDTLFYLNDFYSSDLKHSVKNLSTALEPTMLIIVGSLVGFVVFAIITPIYDITGNIG